MYISNDNRLEMVEGKDMAKKPKKDRLAIEKHTHPSEQGSQILEQQTPPAPGKGEVHSIQAPRPSEPKEVSNQDLFNSIYGGFGPEGKDEQKNYAKANIRRYIEQQIEKYPISATYNIVILYDPTPMIESDADSIYSGVTLFKEKKPILLILHSTGGSVGAAYLIGKLLHEYSDGCLEIVVPRRAKSGATLLCCAADHIHMGSLSELGPIDPQFENLPALGLKSSIQHIAELVKEYPHATDLFARYLSKSVQPIHLG
jgi:hypothetical protein